MVEGVVAVDFIATYLVSASANDDLHVGLETMVNGGYVVSNRQTCCVRVSICDVYEKPNCEQQ